jgi:two-component system response regulator NreC
VTTVIIADDHSVVRTGLVALIQAEPDLQVLGEASDGESAVQLVAALRPDVLILDISMPRLNGIDALQQVRAASPATRVLIFSMHGDRGYRDEVLRAGAAGFITKDAPAAEFQAALRQVVSGGTSFARHESEQAGSLAGLTGRQLQVLRLAASGRTNREIAERLGISPRTAEVHRANLMRKLRLRGVAELVLFATRSGVIDLNGAKQ